MQVCSQFLCRVRICSDVVRLLIWRVITKCLLNWEIFFQTLIVHEWITTVEPQIKMQNTFLTEFYWNKQIIIWLFEWSSLSSLKTVHHPSQYSIMTLEKKSTNIKTIAQPLHNRHVEHRDDVTTYRIIHG